VTQEEARGHLTAMMVVIQRYRSTVAEVTETDVERRVNADLSPWIFGDRCPLPALVKILDRDVIVPLDLYNMMYVLDRFIPEVKLCSEYRWPVPDVSWVALRFEEA